MFFLLKPSLNTFLRHTLCLLPSWQQRTLIRQNIYPWETEMKMCFKNTSWFSGECEIGPCNIHISFMFIHCEWTTLICFHLWPNFCWPLFVFGGGGRPKRSKTHFQPIVSPFHAILNKVFCPPPFFWGGGVPQNLCLPFCI